MNVLKSIPVSYDISLAFIVIMVAILTVYMGFRCVRRLNAVTAIAMFIQLCMLTTGVLTVFNKVLSIPFYEIMMILLGILLPSGFLAHDYLDMKKRIKNGNMDIQLIEKKEKKSNKSWRYDDYIEKPDEWKNEIKAGTIVSSLKLGDKQLRSNITRQLSAVQKLIDREEYRQALDTYIIISELLSNNPMVIYNTAWLSYKNGLFEEAVDYCKKTLDLTGEGIDGKTRKNHDADGGMKSIHAKTHFGYGLCLYSMKKYELAIGQFELAGEHAGELRESQINIARCYIAIGVLDKAQEHIEAALKIGEDSKLRFLLAKLCYEKKEEMKCKYQLESIVSSDDEFTEAWELLGELYRKSEDWTDAQKAYKKLVQLAPQNADNYYYLGVAQREDGKTEEALSSLKFATELMPDHSRAFYSLASIYDAQGDTDKAIEMLHKSLDGNEKPEMAYNLLGEIYISNDRINDAIHVFKAAAKEHPDSYLIHYNLGISLMMMRRFEEAVRAFKRAQKLTDDDPSLYYNWASAEIGLKHYSEAARLYKDGLKFKPDDDEILFGLARVSALSGDVEATLGFLAQAFEINPGLRVRAKASHDFAAFRTLPKFMEITRLPLKEERRNA